VIVNRRSARRFFPGRNAIGERFGFPARRVAKADDEIIGVMSDAKYRSLREPITPTVYSPVVDGFDSGFVLHVRTRQPGGDSGASAAGLAFARSEYRSSKFGRCATGWRRRSAGASSRGAIERLR